MSTSAERKVRMAVALLPRQARERYREQWQGELRDAASLDIPQAEIARGALAVAARINRPFPSWVHATRPRLSFALALSAAVVSLSQFASLLPVTDGNGTDTISGSVASTPLISWVVLIPVFSLIMVVASRRASPREHAAVTMLAAATYLPFLRDPIDSLAPWQWGTWLTFGAYTYAAGGILLVVAVALVWPQYRMPQGSPGCGTRRMRLLRSGVAGLLVGGVVALCSLSESESWNSRKLAVWGQPLTKANRAEFTEWLDGWKAGENMVVTTLTVWLVVGLVLALAVALVGLFRSATPGRTVALAVAATCLVLISFGGTLMFLQIVSLSVVVNVPVDLMMFLARLGMIAVVLSVIVTDDQRRGRSGDRHVDEFELAHG